MAETGITTAVLKGANAPKPMPRRPDINAEQNALSQDDLREEQGYISLENANVTHVTNGGEQVRSLPKGLETSNLSAPKHGAGKGNVSTRSQKPASPGRVGTGRRSGR
jgi:hypothetical protein